MSEHYVTTSFGWNVPQQNYKETLWHLNLSFKFDYIKKCNKK